METFFLPLIDKHGMFRSIFLTMTLSAFFFIALPQKHFAYDNDTHFWLTYYLAIKAGFTPLQSTQIASANISVDFDKDTDPVIPRPSSFLDLRQVNSHFQFVRKQLHALPDKGMISEFSGEEWTLWWDPRIEEKAETLEIAQTFINYRKRVFWSQTLKTRKNPGVFLHYLQDTYAHEGFKSYIGHAGYSNVDFLASDEEKATRMAYATYKYLRAYRETQNGTETLEDFQRVESTEISDEVRNDIDRAIKLFFIVNPSNKRTENQLIRAWNNLDPTVQKKKYKRPPREYYKVVLELRKTNPAPNSSKARLVVIRMLNLTSETAPSIWQYDLSKSGDNKRENTDITYIYDVNHDDSASTGWTSKMEKDNFETKTQKNSKEKKCLPYKLAENSVLEIPLCRVQ